MDKKIKKITTDLLANLAIEAQKLTISTDEDGVFHINLEIKDEDTGILIGYHGDTIAALQLIISLMLYKQTGTWNRLLIEIGDYREKRQQSLEKMAQTTAQRVKFSGEPIALFNLNPFERRIIHTFLTDHSDVVTQSEGEGRDRHLIIRLKSDSPLTPPLPEEPAISSQEPASETQPDLEELSPVDE